MFSIGAFIGLHDRYEILEQIGQGGMGIVLKAYDTILKEIVAIKTLNPDLSKKETVKNRFLNEAKLCLTLNHPNIIRVRDVNIHNEIYYMVMEYIEGEELKSIIKKEQKDKSKDIKKIYNLIRPIFDALAYAHNYTIHRDIKPSNIMIKNDKAYLMDFGISKALEDSELENETVIGGMGTKKYVSPEQAFNATDVDKRSDIYSMGIVFYELLTNHRPKNTSIKEPLNPSLFNTNISKNLANALLKMIAAKPQERFNDFEDVIYKFDELILKENTINFDTNISEDTLTSDTTFTFGQTRDLKSKNDKNMVLIPKGSFIRGSGIESKIDIEKPRKNIDLDDFYISIFPVTNLEYKEFVEALSYKKPKNFDTLLIKHPNYPVVNVSYEDALEYCKFKNVSLPSEAQWEKAAKGGKNYIYPWGNEFKAQYSNIGHITNSLLEVNQLKNGINPYGIYQLAGNIWEWCLDDFETNYYKKSPNKNPINMIDSDLKVLRGGSFDFISNAARNSFRFSGNKTSCENNIGFRVVRNLS